MVTGDDVLRPHSARSAVALETGEPLAASARLISANAYLGAEALMPALQSDADSS